MESFIIEGGHPLTGTIIPQGAKNEALEVIAATLLTSEPVRISNIPDILDVNNLIKLLTDIGMKVTRNSRNDYTFQADELNLEYLASDEYVQKCSALRGSVLIHQKMFESRLFFVDKLIDMGAQIILCDPHRCVIVGHDRKKQLRAGRMTSPDIRAGIALLIAALGAKGTSRIENIAQIDRGYEDIEDRLNALGAKIRRE